MTSRHYICRDCGFVGRGKLMKRGSPTIEKIMWWIFLIPGPFYSLWRILTKYRICNKCMGDDLVSIDSVEGKILFQRQMKKF